LETVGLQERDLTVVNTSDADMVGAASAPDVTSLVTWNPQQSEILATVKDTHLVFDSSRIPGEIIDMLVVNTATLEKHPELGKALAGAWFETMSIMAKDDEKGKAARSYMAKASGTDLAGYESQMKTTKFFFDPAEAVSFTISENLVKTMQMVAGFSFDHGILGEGAKSAEAVGMGFPGGKTLGDTGNIKLRFDETFMKLAADGKL
jgi:NitT/TauT family transport system substrate-binding protein